MDREPHSLSRSLLCMYNQPSFKVSLTLYLYLVRYPLVFLISTSLIDSQLSLWISKQDEVAFYIDTIYIPRHIRVNYITAILLASTRMHTHTRVASFV